MNTTFTSTLDLRKFLKFITIAILVSGILVYITYQARNLIKGPSIHFSDNYTPVQYERAVIITGNTENIVSLTMNGKEIHTDEHGSFKQELILENGYTITTFSAKDRFGRSVSIEREYVYLPLVE